jgi:kynurenine formamidase
MSRILCVNAPRMVAPAAHRPPGPLPKTDRRTVLVDLTLGLTHGMPVAPGYPTPVVLPYPAVGDRATTYISTAEHVATHVDAPLRFAPRRSAIDELGLDWFTGKAVCLDLRHVPDLGEIDVRWLERAEEEANVRVDSHIVLLCTGFHARHWPRPEVLTRNPGLTADATHWLADRRSKAHGVEGPSTDVAGRDDLPSHAVCAARSLIHYEWLINLEQLVGKGEFTFHGYPLRVIGASGSPVRALAELPW